ncbi:MAG TPA: glycosyltransferase family 2 protein [Gaiellaceae bacterium]
MSLPTYSLVIPVYNEEESLPELRTRLAALLDQLDGPGEVVFVDDGSRDTSFAQIEAICHDDSRFKCVRLSRNFGHQIAITAGLDAASGDAVVIMDADLQDPPEVVLEMAARWRQGYEVVYAVRSERAGETKFKQMTAAMFYRLFRRLTDLDVPLDAGDFRLVDRRAVEAFRSMRENNRYVRGMFSWIGFNQTGVEYQRQERFAGETKYPLRKMVRFAADAVVSFSDAPLRLTLTFGFLMSVVALLFGIAAIVAELAGLYRVPGLASIAVLIAFIGGVQLIVLGVVGAYVARIHDEVKNRPLYLIREVRGLVDSVVER